MNKQNKTVIDTDNSIVVIRGKGEIGEGTGDQYMTEGD